MDYRKPSELTFEELDDICNRLATDETHVSIARSYNVREGSLRRKLLRLTTDYYYDRASSQRALRRYLDVRSLECAVDTLAELVERLGSRLASC